MDDADLPSVERGSRGIEMRWGPFSSLGCQTSERCHKVGRVPGSLGFEDVTLERPEEAEGATRSESFETPGAFGGLRLGTGLSRITHL